MTDTDQSTGDFAITEEVALFREAQVNHLGQRVAVLRLERDAALKRVAELEALLVEVTSAT